MDEKIKIKELDIHEHTKKRTFLLRKLNSSISEKNIIKSEVSKYLNDPDTFLNNHSNIVFNRKINIKKIIPIEMIKPSISKSIGRNISKFNFQKEKINNKVLVEEKEEQSPKINFEKIDKERLKSIFISFKKLSENIKKKKILNNYEKNDLEDSEIFDKNIPKQLSLDLGIQNRTLKAKKSLDKQSRQTSKYLSRKINKKENDLLFNSVHLYRYKKEILGKEESKDNYNNVNNQSFLFKWISSLRRPKQFYGKIENYINVSSNSNPLWSIIVEKYPITKEISIKSGSDLNNKDYKDFTKKRNNDLNSSERIKKVEDLDGISVQGKSLIDLEYNREMSSNSKSRLLHKVFVDNGKVIMYNDINKIFGDETIYKNYNGRNKRNKKMNFSIDNERYSKNNRIFIPSLKSRNSSYDIYKRK